MLGTLAILSGVLQVAGYVLYIKKTLGKEINPNPTSWLMWAYGTTLVLVLELDRNAGWEILLLPFLCAVSSLGVAVICWKHGVLRWPSHVADKAALGVDIALTIAYISAWALMSSGILSEEGKESADVLILVTTSLSTVITYGPMIRNLWSHPNDEQWLPWAVWTSAYALLFLTTLLSPEWTWDLLVYPATCFFLSGAVAILARSRLSPVAD